MRLKLTWTAHSPSNAFPHAFLMAKSKPDELYWCYEKHAAPPHVSPATINWALQHVKSQVHSWLWEVEELP